LFTTNLTSNSSDIQNTLDYRVCKSQGHYCTKGFFGPVFQIVELPNTTTTTTTYQNQYFMSPMTQFDFSPIGEVELENTEQD